MALLTAKTENGWVEGLPAGNQAVSVFKGIPFAAPPVGDLRWKAPQPAADWDGVLKAYTFSKIPMQLRTVKGSPVQKEFYPVDLPRSEDCLYLNIWTPAESADEKLPVAFWIFGGAYRQGYANKLEFDGEAFAKRGVVYVSINYRVGIFGYIGYPGMEKEDPNGSACNYGLLDQIAALKWVKRNIAQFGGDPDNIGIFGQSAGGLSVQALVTSPLSKNDVAKAVMQSGGGVGGRLRSMPMEKNLEYGRRFLNFAGANSIEEARAIDGETLLAKFDEYQKIEPINFMTSVDGYALTEDCSVTIMKGEHADIPYIMGCTGDEGAVIDPEADYEKFTADAKEAYGDKADEFIKTVGGRKIERQTSRAGSAAWCMVQNELGRAPSYQYVLNRRPLGDDRGAFHACEHVYVQQTLLRSWRPYNGDDFDMSNTVNKYWVNFFKTGNPNGDGLPKWEPFEKNNQRPMLLDVPCGMDKNDIDPAVKFMAEYMIGTMKKEIGDEDVLKKARRKYVPDPTLDYTEEELADYFMDTCSGE